MRRQFLSQQNRHPRIALVLAVASVAVAGCGAAPQVAGPEPAATPTELSSALRRPTNANARALGVYFYVDELAPEGEAYSLLDSSGTAMAEMSIGMDPQHTTRVRVARGGETFEAEIATSGAITFRENGSLVGTLSRTDPSLEFVPSQSSHAAEILLAMAPTLGVDALELESTAGRNRQPPPAGRSGEVAAPQIYCGNGYVATIISSIICSPFGVIGSVVCGLVTYQVCQPAVPPGGQCIGGFGNNDSCGIPGYTGYYERCCTHYCSGGLCTN